MYDLCITSDMWVPPTRDDGRSNAMQKMRESELELSGGEGGGPLDVLALVASETLKKEPVHNASYRGRPRGKGSRPKAPPKQKRFVCYFDSLILLKMT